MASDILDPRTPGLSVSPYPPELQGEAASLHRRRALADMLMLRAMQPMQQPTGYGGIPVPMSPLAGLSHVAQMGLGVGAGSGVDQGEAALANRYSEGLRGATKQVTDLTGQGKFDEASQVASQWPALKAISEKLLERQIAPRPVYHPYESTSPEGTPVTKWYDPSNPPEGAIPKPVKMAFENTGGEITPVNPYTQTEPLKKTLDPNRVPTPEDLEANAQLIASYRAKPIEGYSMRAPGGAAVMRRVLEINPGYDSKVFNTGKLAEVAFASGKQGNTIRSFNVALNHLDTLDKAAENLGNMSFRPGNQLYNYVSEQLGQPAPTEFSAIKKIVGDEIVKAVIGGGGGVADREEAANTISRANSPEQLKQVMAKYRDLMKGQLSGLRQQYIASTGKQDFDKFLTQEGLTAAGRPQRRASDQPGGVIDFNSLPK